MPSKDFDTGAHPSSGRSDTRRLTIPRRIGTAHWPLPGSVIPRCMARRYWLQVEGSFTRALQRQCTETFHVEVQHEGFAVPTREEAQHLGLPARQRAWIREVRLCGDGQPWVLARTIIPLSCLEGRGRRLRHLGNRPLGAYLFSSPDWQRGPLETGLCNLVVSGQPAMARRSMFCHRKQCLLVGEYLLPDLFN